MIKKIGNMVLVWISILCLSTIIILVQSTCYDSNPVMLFTAGYVVAALICVMMFCTILSICLNGTESCKVNIGEKAALKVSKEETSATEKSLSEITTEPVLEKVTPDVVEGLHEALASD